MCIDKYVMLNWLFEIDLFDPFTVCKQMTDVWSDYWWWKEYFEKFDSVQMNDECRIELLVFDSNTWNSFCLNWHSANEEMGS